MAVLAEREAVAEGAQTVELRGVCYGERRRTVAALEDVMLACGCWLHERDTEAMDRLTFVFEVQLRSVVELYGELARAGVELAREGHAAMAGLCTLRRHHPRKGRWRMLMVRLEVRFAEEYEAEMAMMGVGLA
jgi:hypothetical protein